MTSISVDLVLLLIPFGVRCYVVECNQIEKQHPPLTEDPEAATPPIHAHSCANSRHEMPQPGPAPVGTDRNQFQNTNRGMRPLPQGQLYRKSNFSLTKIKDAAPFPHSLSLRFTPHRTASKSTLILTPLPMAFILSYAIKKTKNAVQLQP